MLALLVRAAATLILIVLCVCVKKRARENEKLEITEGAGGGGGGAAQHQNCTQCLTDKKCKSLPREFIAEMSLIAQGLIAPSACVANYSHEQPHRLRLKDSWTCSLAHSD